MIIQSLQLKNGTLLTVNLTVIIHKMMHWHHFAYILVAGNITTTPNNAATQVVFKNCAPFEKCRT